MILTQFLSLSLVPWAQCPLVSMTYFTKWLQFVPSIAIPCRVQISLLHQSTRSSVHLLLALTNPMQKFKEWIIIISCPLLLQKVDMPLVYRSPQICFM